MTRGRMVKLQEAIRQSRKAYSERGTPMRLPDGYSVDEFREGARSLELTMKSLPPFNFERQRLGESGRRFR
jgi:hypothetical protein